MGLPLLANTLGMPMTSPRPARRLILVVFFLLGSVAVVTQSLLVREFLVLAFGNELSLGLTFFGWLAGVAVGAAAGGRISRHERARLAAFVLALVLLAFLAPAMIVVIRTVRGAFAVGPGEYLSLWTMLWLNPALTVPVSFLIGFAFPLAAALIARDRSSVVAPPCGAPDNGRATRGPDYTTDSGADPIAKVYAAEAAGSLLGGALFSFVLIEHVAPFHLIGGSGTLLLIAAALLLWKHGWTSQPWHISCLALLPAVAFAVAAVLWGGSVERWTVERRWASFKTGTEIALPGPVDSRYQNITLAKREDEYTVFLDGLEAMSFPNVDLPASTHFVMCEAKAVRRVLLIGGGLEGRIAEMLRHPVERLDYVTLDPKLVALVHDHLPEGDRTALADRRVHVHYDDGRHFLIEHAPRLPYDLIFMDMPEPSSVLLNRFYTREFFDLIGRRLAPNGLFAFGLTASPSYFSETRRKYLGSIWKALEGTFKERLATWGETTVILAASSRDVFTTDGDELVRRYTSRGVKSADFNPLWFKGASDMLRRANLEKIRGEIHEGARAAETNTDRTPRAYLHHLILWDRVVSGRKASAFEHLDRVGLPVVAVAVVGVFLLWALLAGPVLGKSRVESATLFSVAATGFTSMSLELVLLIAFQCLFGYVYARVGIIVGVFMLGLVGGSLFMRRVIGRKPVLGVKALWGFDAGIAVFAVAVAAALWLLGGLSSRGFTWAAEWGIMTLVLVSGLLGGSIVPLSAHIMTGERKGTGRVAGSVDAADHVGACIGALVTGVVLIPAIGITLTCVLIAILKLLSCAFLSVAGRRRPSAPQTGT